MCGICGQIRFDGHDPDAAVVRSMQELLAHRGPDGQGRESWSFEGGGAALAHTRLSILDLSSAGRQPMSDPTGRYWIVYNGEVYNFRGIAADLAKQGVSFSTRTDTEVVLAAYIHYGPDCLKRFNGMFSLAIWDMREKALFCARDRLGIKPFYYSFEKGVFTFASEIKALIHGAGVSREPDRDAVYDYLAWGLLDHGPNTFFRHVRQLAPGTRLAVNGPSPPRPQVYWQLRPPREQRQDDAGQRFLELFSDSVRLRLISDVPVGVLLSGGLDSSAIACVAARVSPENIPQTFSSTLKDGGLDESEYSRAVARHISAENFQLVPQSQRFWEELDSMLYFQDEPVHASDIYANWCMMREVRQTGTKVLLNGQGGDELFAGYGWYVKNFLTSLLVRGRLKDFFREMGALTRNFPGTMTTSRTHLLANVAQCLVPGRVKIRLKSDLAGVGRTLRSEFGRQCRPRNQMAVSKVNAATLETKSRNDILFFNVPHYLHYEDRNSMAFSIEERVPFLDHRLVEWAQELPVTWKIHQGQSKYVMRRALRGLLPTKVLERKDKMGLSIPVERWFGGELSARVRDFFQEPCLMYDDFVDRKVFLNDFSTYSQSQPNHLHRTLWRYFSLEKWLQLQQEGPKNVLKEENSRIKAAGA